MKHLSQRHKTAARLPERIIQQKPEHIPPTCQQQH